MQLRLEQEERNTIWGEYYEYLRSEWEANCIMAGIPFPVWLQSMTIGYDGEVTYVVGHDPPGPCIALTYLPGDLLPEPPM